MTDLFPCPFCGGDKIRQVMSGISGVRYQCVSCDTVGPDAKSSMTAIEKWNTRSQPVCEWHIIDNEYYTSCGAAFHLRDDDYGNDSPPHCKACGGKVENGAPEVYVVAVGDAALGVGFELAEDLRDALPDMNVELNLGGGSFKSQLKRADKSGAKFAVVLGDDEVTRGAAGLKPLRSDEDQTSIAFGDLAEALRRRI